MVVMPCRQVSQRPGGGGGGGVVGWVLMSSALKLWHKVSVYATCNWLCFLPMGLTFPVHGYNFPLMGYKCVQVGLLFVT